MSGHLNSINNTYMDNTSPYSPPESEKPKKRGRSKDDTAAREVIDRWLVDNHLDSYLELHSKLMDFCDARRDSKAGALTAKAASLMLDRLSKYAGGSITAMLAMLDNSIINNWAGIFPLKADERRRTGLAPEPAQYVLQPDEEDGGAYLCL